MYAFFKIRGPEGARTGYFVPNLYKLVSTQIGVKLFGLSYVKDRLSGWTYWWVKNEEDCNCAIETLKELRKARIFDYKVWRDR